MRRQRLPRDPKTRLILTVLIVLFGLALRWYQDRETPKEPAPRPSPTTRTDRRDGGNPPGPGKTSGREAGQGYTPPAAPAQPPGTDAVASFNIKWFGSSGSEVRSDEDVEAIAATIRATGAAVLGLQEIGDEETMDRLLGYLPGWRYVMGTSGRGQRLAILWDGSRASVGRAAEWPDINRDLERNAGTLRAPLVAPSRIGQFDFLLVVVHQKAMFDDRSLQMRREQGRRLRKRLDEWAAKNSDKDIIVVGDFNDFAGSPALAEFTGGRQGGAGFVNAGARLPDDAITHLSPNGRIDHIMISSPAVSQEEWTGKAFTLPRPRGKARAAYERGVSDHLPTWATFRTDRDNDP